MRLYLSSYGLGNHPEKLVELVGSNKKVAVILNAQDSKPVHARTERLLLEMQTLKTLGFIPTEIDLRHYFKKQIVRENLLEFGLVWVRGGNIFNLQRAIKKSGFDKVITELLKENELTYGGYSAGACALIPSLHGIELCDKVDDIPNNYPTEIVWDGLGLIPYAIAPHYKSDHPETKMIDDVIAYFKQHQIPYKALRDGEVIIINGSNETLVK